MSDGTPKPATWPIWRGPLAYGHATATRIFCGFAVTRGLCFRAPTEAAHDTSGVAVDPQGRGEQGGQSGESRQHDRRHEEPPPMDAMPLRPVARARCFGRRALAAPDRDAGNPADLRLGRPGRR